LKVHRYSSTLKPGVPTGTRNPVMPVPLPGVPLVRAKTWTFSGRLSRSRAVLGGGAQAIMVETAGWRPQATVEVQGEWEHRDLVVLACFFAAIARRRRSTFVGTAVPGK
ncbi:MAG: hypothetical protein ACXVFA_19195, partial [Solirubrobacteraceae bacterium]